MKPAPQHEDTLSHVALLLEQQRYDEALEILGDLMKENPSDREIRVYRLLLVRILVLRHTLTHPTTTPASYPRAIAGVIMRAASALQAFQFHKMPRLTVRTSQTREMPLGESDSQLNSRVVQLTQQLDDLTTKNTELLEEVNSLSSNLAASERAVEHLQMQHRTEPGNQQLEAVNRELQHEITTIEEQLRRSEIRLSESSSQHQKLTAHDANLQSEVAQLKDQLQATNHELEAGQKHLFESQSEHQRILAENQQLQQVIAELQTQLEQSEARFSEAASTNQNLTDCISKLETEVAELIEQLQGTQKTIRPLEAEQQRLASVELENQQLQQEIANLRGQLRWSERLQTELAAVEQQLAESQSRARQSEAAQQQVANLNSRELIYTEQQQQLEARIVDLDRELSATKEEVDVTQYRLAEMEDLCQELRAEKRQLEEEISAWQERLAQSEEYQRQLSILRRQLDPVETDQASFSDRSSALQKTSRAGLELVPVSSESAVGDPIRPAIQTSPRHFAIIVGIILLTISGIVGFGLLGPSADKRSESNTAAGAPDVISEKQSIATETAGKTPKRPTAAAVPSVEKNKSSNRPQARKPAPRVRGTFETIRPTQVYRGPSQHSQVITTIDVGTEITVVGSRDGWLEIRSSYGRPAGYVRQDAAVRIDNTAG
jgi:chromosome segregation ATPase